MPIFTLIAEDKDGTEAKLPLKLGEKLRGYPATITATLF